MKTTEEKIEYLKKLLGKLLLFSRHYSKVMLTKSGTYLIVMWYAPKQENWYSNETIEFPIKDLDIRLEHYKNKLRYNFKKRNNNKKLN